MFTNNRNVWITKSGNALWVGEMTDEHIVNAYKMIVRNKQKMQEASTAAWSMSFQGEMAQYYQDQSINEISDALLEIQQMEEMLFKEIQERRLENKL